MMKTRNIGFVFQSYFISEPQYYNLNKKVFNNCNIDICCFRDKTILDSKKKELLAKEFLDDAKQADIKKVLINSDIELAIKLKFDGVHLNSKQFNKISYAKNQKLFVVISCHTKSEIIQAYKNGANAVTYSPIFYKENKGIPKGLDDLAKIVNNYQKSNFFIIALGGIITQDHIDKIRSTNAYGFGCIRYFYNFIKDIQ